MSSNRKCVEDFLRALKIWHGWNTRVIQSALPPPRPLLRCHAETDNDLSQVTPQEPNVAQEDEAPQARFRGSAVTMAIGERPCAAGSVPRS